MSDLNSPRIIIRQLAPVIAAELGIRLSTTRLPRKALGLIHNAVHRAVKSDVTELVPSELAKSLEKQIEQAASTIPYEDERPYYVSRLLVDVAWMVPRKSPVGDILFRLFLTYYERCRTQDSAMAEFLRETITERLYSNFALVRRLAAHVNSREPVSQLDMTVLKSNQTHDDVRIAIANRILRQGSQQQQAAVLVLLRELEIAAKRRLIPSAGESLKQLLDAIGYFAHRQEVFEGIYIFYTEHFYEASLRGYLLKLLATLASHSLTQLREDALTVPTASEPVAALLAHMIHHHHIADAVSVFADIVEQTGNFAVMKLFRNTIKRHSKRENASETIRSEFIRVRDHFSKLGGELADLAQDIDEAVLRWGQSLTEEQIIDHLEGITTLKPGEIRDCGQHGFEVFQRVVVAHHLKSPAEVGKRLRALKDVLDMRALPIRHQVRQLLWEVYVSNDVLAIRKAALSYMIAVEKRFSDAEIKRLNEDRHRAEPEIQKILKDEGNYFFGTTQLGENRGGE